MYSRGTCRQTAMTELSLNDQIEFIEKELRSWTQVINFLQSEFGQHNLDSFSKEAIEHICHLEAIRESLQTLQATKK